MYGLVAATWTRALPMSVDPLGPGDVDPDTARDRACDVTTTGRICNPPEPDAPDPPEPPDVSGVGDASGGVGALGNVLVVLLVIALVVAVVWLVMRWLGDADRLGDDDELEDLDEDIDEIVDARIVDEETPPDRWRRLAAEARGRGDFRESVRCRYRALIGDLARAGYVDEIPGRTSGEEREQVAELAPDIARDFDVAAGTFDEAWFNHLPVTVADDERFEAAERTVLDAVLSGAGRRLGGRA